jgi:acyl-CoA thioester hydrolase
MKHSVEYKVYYEDTDAGQIMYHGRYINWCERARMDFTHDLGIDFTAMHNEGVLIVVRHLEADYFKPAKLEQLLRVESGIKELKNSSFIMNQSIFCQDSVLFSMTVTLVCIDLAGRPVRIPESIRSKFADYQE